MKTNIPHLLHNAAASLSAYLENILPQLFDNWWSQGVLSSLSFQQQRRVERQGINALSSLDLAALLRVLDHNWNQIAMKRDLSSDSNSRSNLLKPVAS